MSDTTLPIEAEAAGEQTATVEWRDLSFEIPRERGDWPLDAELALRADDPIAFAQAIMPAEAFETLRASKPKNRDVADLSGAIVQALGFKDTGE